MLINVEAVTTTLGRPTVVTEQVKKSLMEAYLIDCNDAEACMLANICPATLYNYQKRDPEFFENKIQWKQNPILKARVTLYNALSNPIYAWKYLLKKAPDLKS